MSNHKDMTVPGAMVSALLKAVKANHKGAMIFGDAARIVEAREVLRTVELAAAPTHHVNAMPACTESLRTAAIAVVKAWHNAGAMPDTSDEYQAVGMAITGLSIELAPAPTRHVNDVERAAVGLPPRWPVCTEDDAWIVKVWESMPGGPVDWLKGFGYVQFARAVLAAAPGTWPIDSVAQNLEAQLRTVVKQRDDKDAAMRQMTIALTEKEWADLLAPDAVVSGLEAAIGDVLEELRSLQEAQRWISVDTELPPVGEDVLCLRSGDPLMRVGYVGLNGDPYASIGWNVYDGDVPPPVTHWMHLPEAPV